jgi:hypothetical protein
MLRAWRGVTPPYVGIGARLTSAVSRDSGAKPAKA